MTAQTDANTSLLEGALHKEASIEVASATVVALPAGPLMLDVCSPGPFVTNADFKQVALALDTLDIAGSLCYLSPHTHQGNSGDVRRHHSAEHIETGLLAGTAPGLPFPKPDPTSGSLLAPKGDASDR